MKEEGMDRKGALELVSYILKRLKGVARDLDDHGHEDLSKILFVKASEIDDEICKIETKETAEAFNEVRNQGYNQALDDILHEYSNWAGILDQTTLRLVDICKKFRKE